jgi:molybdopterin-binding protein
VTHDFAEAGLLGEVSVLLDGGRMLQAGPTAEVFRRPASPYVAEFLGAENVFAGTVSTDSAADASGSTPGSRAVQFECAGLVIHAVSDMPDGPAHAVIRGEEVVIARTPSVSSARNHFVGLVRELDARGPWARVVVEVDGVPLVAMLTSSAVGDLELETGQSVEVAFKAFAVHLC